MGLSSLFSGTPAAVGIELTLLTATSWQARTCQLSRTGATVTIGQQRDNLTELPALVEALGSEPGPVALVLTGRGLLLRAVPTASADQAGPDTTQLTALLPGSKPTDFYCQYAVGAEQTLVALVRRAPVEELLAAFAAAGLWVVAVSLGPLGFAAVVPYLPAADRQVPLPAGSHLLTLDHNGEQLAGIAAPVAEELPEHDYQLGGETITSAQVLAYAAALSLLAGDEPAVSSEAELPVVAHQRAEWVQRRWFYRLRLGVPVGILALLLANLLVGQQLQARQDELAGAVGGNQQLLGRVRAAQQAAQQQQAFLSATGWTQPSVNSLCADRLAASLPAGVQLLTVDISPQQPLTGEPGHRLHFRPDVVTVRGQCANAQQFNAWLQRLTRQPWVQAVREQNFAYDYAGGQGTFTFTLLLKPAALDI
jgi:hypothetical protein